MARASPSPSGPASERHCPDVLSAEHARLIADRGISALPGFREWAPERLEEQWEASKAPLMAAVKRVREVSQHGPIKVVFIDLETCDREHLRLPTGSTVHSTATCVLEHWADNG